MGADEQIEALTSQLDDAVVEALTLTDYTELAADVRAVFAELTAARQSIANLQISLTEYKAALEHLIAENQQLRGDLQDARDDAWTEDMPR